MFAFLTTKINRVHDKLNSIQADEDGSVSITTVFFVIFFAMLLGMLMNIGRHADREIIMQNGSDAASYSGGVVLSRGMNTLVFMNHLEADVFGVVAYLRESEVRNAEAEALQRLENVPPEYEQQAAIERALILTFGNLNASIAAQLLPTLEGMLQTEQIPDFQRELTRRTPEIAMDTANEIIGRHAPGDAGVGNGAAAQFVLYRADQLAFSEDPLADRSTLPVVDPTDASSGADEEYFDNATRQRAGLARRYLRTLNQERLQDLEGKTPLSDFTQLWRQHTSSQLQQLFDENLNRNLPFQLRRLDSQFSPNQSIENDTMFVGMMYWGEMPERLPGLFENPMDADDVAFTQIRLFLPRPRLVYDPTQPPDEQIGRDGAPMHRNLLNQNWTTQMVPASLAGIPSILEESPDTAEITPLNLGGINVEEFRRLNTH